MSWVGESVGMTSGARARMDDATATATGHRRCTNRVEPAIFEDVDGSRLGLQWVHCCPNISVVAIPHPLAPALSILVREELADAPTAPKLHRLLRKMTHSIGTAPGPGRRHGLCRPQPDPHRHGQPVRGVRLHLPQDRSRAVRSIAPSY